MHRLLQLSMTPTSKAIHVVYLLVMLRVVQKTQRRSPVLEGMEGFILQMLTGEYAHLLLAGNAAAVVTWLRRLSKRQPSQATWLDAGLVSTHLLLLGRLAHLAMTNANSADAFRRAFIEHGLVSPVDADRRIGNRTWNEWWSVWNPLPFAFHFPGHIQTVTYGWVGERLPHALQMDVYRHHNCAAMPPVLLFIHGGGWMLGSKSMIPSSLLHAVAQKGWLFCAMDYRKAPFVSFPDHLIDCKRAVAYLRSSSRTLRADTSKIVVCGESAGGHLASLLAITADDKFVHRWTPQLLLTLATGRSSPGSKTLIAPSWHVSMHTARTISRTGLAITDVSISRGSTAITSKPS
ncbi:hypothetical protein, variant 1 [Aphanomyces invadans]|uniref:BD-FAE-like domain-containing protein n=1 Tax=Aphanomyces invadans TaxID=157072 RepID=A0A024UR31_9STRA|nr:hypothetical protein, variant 1 [Aphanomyces invadans]ETW08073.1 hypothetical protein, variant 1 [Aphanomyces invadans]|eukprot:XP_008864166.1 hypothetical protein, variant 1 [Aphanomyces invadans]